MAHKYAVGTQVYFDGGINSGARGLYKVVRHLPVERDNNIRYRVKSVSEAFERTVDEEQLRRQA